MIFQKMRKAKSMQKEREKGRKTLLFDSKSDAFS